MIQHHKQGEDMQEIIRAVVFATVALIALILLPVLALIDAPKHGYRSALSEGFSAWHELLWSGKSPVIRNVEEEC